MAGRKPRIATLGKPCCGSVESSAQTDVSLPHVHRDVLWTAPCLAPMTDFDDDCVSVVIEAPTNSLSVLDVDSIEVVHHDDADDLGDANDDGSAMPAMEASESELDDLDTDADDPDETDELDDAANADDDVGNKNDDTQTKSNCNVRVAISMFLIILANICAKTAIVVENPSQHKALKT